MRSLWLSDNQIVQTESTLGAQPLETWEETAKCWQVCSDLMFLWDACPGLETKLWLCTLQFQKSHFSDRFSFSSRVPDFCWLEENTHWKLFGVTGYLCFLRSHLAKSFNNFKLWWTCKCLNVWDQAYLIATHWPHDLWACKPASLSLLEKKDTLLTEMLQA